VDVEPLSAKNLGSLGQTLGTSVREEHRDTGTQATCDGATHSASSKNNDRATEHGEAS
jgi:hypothetical protein